MKLHGETRTLETGGLLETSSFQIKASAHAFKILSSNLYTDKPLAIVRELSCNAFDAHIAAHNRQVPFEVHMPTRLDPSLRIKDYGTGLSPEQVFNLYTTYFDSDKNTTNELTGGLGLGSKSPFSYVDSYTVVCTWGGKKTTYTAYLTKDGTPSISKINAEDSDDHNGLEIIVPIQPQDFQKFYEAGQKCLRWFDPAPKTPGLEIKKAEYSLKTEHFGILKDANSNYSNKGYGAFRYRAYGSMYALQGTVCYPVQTDKLGTLTRHEENILRSITPVIFIPIGSVDIAASREELSYDKQTIEFLTDKARSIVAKLKKEVIEKIDNLATIREAQIYVWENTHAFRRLFTESDPPKWKNTALFFDTHGRTNKTCRQINWDTRKGKPIANSVWEGGLIDLTANTTVYIDDLGKPNKASARIKHAINNNNKLIAVLIKPEHTFDFNKLKQVGIPFIKVSTLDDPPKKKRDKSVITAATSLMGVHKSFYTSYYLKPFNQPINLKDYEYYIKVVRKTPDKDSHPTDLFATMNRFKNVVTIPLNKIVALPKKEWGLLKHAPHLKPAQNIFVEKLKAKLINRDVRKEYKRACYKEGVAEPIEAIIFEYALRLKSRNKTHALSTIAQKHSWPNHDDTESMYDLAVELGVCKELDHDPSHYTDEGREEINKLLEKYPLLKFVSGYYKQSDELTKALDHYLGVT